MIENVGLIFDFLLEQFTSIGTLYTTTAILGASLALWALGRLINIIRRIIP